MENIYLPDLVELVEVREETADTSTFALRFVDPARWADFQYRPGQFVEVSVLGVGEAPFCLASARDGGTTFEITARRTGAVTRALHQLRPGDRLGVRGPLGNGFPFDEVKGRDLLFVGGGIGLPPLRPLIWQVLAQRGEFAKVTVLYGARTPGDLVYRDELREWEDRSDLTLLLTVDVGDEAWPGPVGLVTTLFDQVAMTPTTTAFVCGPPIMIQSVIGELRQRGVPEEAIVTTLERHMRCGVGKCNHCLIGDKYVCTDGPVFTYRQLKTMLSPG